MISNILSILASNVLKIFLSIIVSIGVYIAQTSTNQPESQICFIELAATLVGKKEI